MTPSLQSKIDARIQKHWTAPQGTRHKASLQLAGWLVKLAENGVLTRAEVEAHFSEAVKHFADPAHHMKIVYFILDKCKIP